MPGTIKENDKLILSYPDGFHVMDDTEKSDMRFYNGSSGTCLSDPERHILVSIGWNPIKGLSALLIRAEDAAKKMETGIRKPMQQYDYRLIGFVSKEIGNEKAEGFSYEYETQGIPMYGESYVVRHDGVLYYLNCYLRKELANESLEVWNAILSSAEWQ